MLQPYGSMFFASAPVLEDQLPVVTEASTNSVVILRLRGRTDLGSTMMEILVRNAQALSAEGSKLMLVSASEPVLRQFEAAGISDVVGDDNIYATDEWLGATVRQAYGDANEWVAGHQTGEADGEP